MNIRNATEGDISAVAALYEQVHDAEEAGLLTIGWARGVYPTLTTARAALDRGDLFVQEEGGALVGAAVINQIQVDVYAGAPWRFDAPDDRVLVLHTLVISPKAAHRGYGSAFAAFYEERARALGCSVLRIDTNERNAAARALYRKLGYREAAVVPTTFNGIPGVRLVLLEKSLL